MTTNVTPKTAHDELEFIRQCLRKNAELNRKGIPTDQRRRAVRARGYRGPLTRQELAKRCEQ